MQRQFDYTKDKYIIYTIYHNNIPIYIGSTYNIKARESGHNKELTKCYRQLIIPGDRIDYNLYNYCVLNKILVIELKPIFECFDDIVIIGKGRYEKRRFLTEEEYINKCIDIGIKLTNIRWSTFYDKNGNERSLKNNNVTIDYTNCSFNKHSII